MPNKIEVQNGNKKGQIKKLIYCYIDFEDYEHVSKHKWYLHERGGNKYPVAHFANGPSDTKMSGGVMSMSRYLMNAKKGEEAVCIDGDNFNCRRNNLRIQKIGEQGRISQKHKLNITE